MMCKGPRIFLCAVVAGALSYSTAVNATNIHSNEITDGNPSSANPFTAGQTVASNITVSGIGRGTGLGPNSGGDRYNATNWTTGTSLDANDYFSWTLTANSGYQIDFTSLTGNWQRSNTGPASYSLRSSLDNYGSQIVGGTIASGASAFNLNLGATQFNTVTGPITFRLYGWGGTGGSGTFSVNDFIFDGTVSALVTGNNSVISAPSSLGLGRVMQGQTASQGINLTKTGTDATTYTATPNNNGLSITADGAIPGGSQSESVSVLLQNNANGSATTGAKSFTLTVDNTASTSAASGQGSADANDSVNVTATVVGNRTINSTAVNLGNVIVGASANPQFTILNSPGDDDSNTRVTVNGTAATNGDVIVAAAASMEFDSPSDSTSRSVSGTFSSAGPKSGSVDLSVTGEGLVGEAVNPLSVAYTAVAFDPSSALFASTDTTSLTIDFGNVWEMTGEVSIEDAIYNALQTAGFTAELDFDVISGTGDIGVLYTDLINDEFTSLSAGGNGYSFLSTINTNNPQGLYSATYTLGLSDADHYAGAGAANSQILTLTLVGNIIPEPGTILLAIPGLISVVLSGGRRRRTS